MNKITNDKGLDIVVGDMYSIGTQKNSMEVVVKGIIDFHGQHMAQTEYGDMNIDLLFDRKYQCHNCQSGCPVCGGSGWLYA